MKKETIERILSLFSNPNFRIECRDTFPETYIHIHDSGNECIYCTVSSSVHTIVRTSSAVVIVGTNHDVVLLPHEGREVQIYPGCSFLHIPHHRQNTPAENRTATTRMQTANPRHLLATLNIYASFFAREFLDLRFTLTDDDIIRIGSYIIPLERFSAFCYRENELVFDLTGYYLHLPLSGNIRRTYIYEDETSIIHDWLYKQPAIQIRRVKTCSKDEIQSIFLGFCNPYYQVVFNESSFSFSDVPRLHRPYIVKEFFYKQIEKIEVERSVFRIHIIGFTSCYTVSRLKKSIGIDFDENTIHTNLISRADTKQVHVRYDKQLFKLHRFACKEENYPAIDAILFAFAYVRRGNRYIPEFVLQTNAFVFRGKAYKFSDITAINYNYRYVLMELSRKNLLCIDLLTGKDSIHPREEPETRHE